MSKNMIIFTKIVVT